MELKCTSCGLRGWGVGGRARQNGGGGGGGGGVGGGGRKREGTKYSVGQAARISTQATGPLTDLDGRYIDAYVRARNQGCSAKGQQT